jgi:hypothetical protein
VGEFAADPARRPLARVGNCQVAACPQERRGGPVAHCETHQHRWIRDHRADPGLDEARWRVTTSPIVVTGQVSLAGMPPLVTAQVLYGLQQRTRSGARTRLQVLRAVVHDLRRTRADSVIDAAAAGPSGRMRREKRTVLAALARHAALAVSDPETERAKDVWELAVFGLRGWLSFTAISQPWLREAAKRWAADELPRHRGDGAGRVLRSLIGSLVRLSRSLQGSRADHGDHPAALGRADVESFLHRMSYLVSTGECSAELRAKICRDVKRILGRIRALGLTRPGGPAAGLGDDFTLAYRDIPAEPERGEPGRNLPTAIMAQLCAQLPLLERGRSPSWSCPRPRTPTPPAPSRSAAACSTCATATGSTSSRCCAAPTAPSSTEPRSCPTPTGTPTPNATPTPVSASTCCPSSSITARSRSPAATTGSGNNAAAPPSTP